MPHKNRLDKISTIIANKKKLLGALRKGVEEALLKHKQLGKPIVVWKDNKAVWIPPEKIVIEKQKVSRRRK